MKALMRVRESFLVNPKAILKCIYFRAVVRLWGHERASESPTSAFSVQTQDERKTAGCQQTSLRCELSPLAPHRSYCTIKDSWRGPLCHWIQESERYVWKCAMCETFPWNTLANLWRFYSIATNFQQFTVNFSHSILLLQDIIVIIIISTNNNTS